MDKYKDWMEVDYPSAEKVTSNSKNNEKKRKSIFKKGMKNGP